MRQDDVQRVEVQRLTTEDLSCFHDLFELAYVPRPREYQETFWYERQVEEALIVSLADFGIAGERSVGQTGVWTQGRKIASIGVHPRDWVTWHSFAVNVTTDLSYLDLMVPCGIQSVTMTSISREMADSSALMMERVEASVVATFGSVCALAPRDVAHVLGYAIRPA